MKLKLLSAAALSLALMSGAALAQNTSSTNPEPVNPAPGQPTETILGNAEMMGVFYTDGTMATLRTDDELRTAWSGLSAENRAAISAECQTKPEGEYEGVNIPTFCEKVGTFQ